MTRRHIFPDDYPSMAARTGTDTARQKLARRAIISRHARRWTYGPKWGQPMFCTPSTAELDGEADNLGSAGKIIYDTLETARLAAAELLTATGIGFRPYECPRSRHGHHHLTTKAPLRRET